MQRSRNSLRYINEELAKMGKENLGYRATVKFVEEIEAVGDKRFWRLGERLVLGQDHIDQLFAIQQKVSNSRVPKEIKILLILLGAARRMEWQDYALKMRDVARELEKIHTEADVQKEFLGLVLEDAIAKLQ